MALFEYDEGHLIPAQFGRPVASEDQAEILNSVRAQVLEIIARPLFPVTWSDDGAAPRLAALDGSGQVVMVEVVATLTPEVLIASLGRLGAVSSLGWNDLAQAYPGGLDAFRSGWAQFRDSMPPHLEAGPRLVLVATEIDPSVRPALDALAASGLEVHHISVREMSNGRRFLDVQRLATTLFSHNPNILAGRAARVGAIAMEPFTEPSPQTGSISRQSILEATHTPQVEPSVRRDEDSLPNSLHAGEQRVLDATGAVRAVGSPGAPVATSSFSSAEGPAARSGGDSASTAEAAKLDNETTAELAALPERLERDQLGMQTLAQVIGQDTPLVWPLEEDRQKYLISATFKLDGTIEMEGRSFPDPSVLCASLGYPQQDGWQAWHLGDENGPTLADATEEMNQELRRASRGHGAHPGRHE